MLSFCTKTLEEIRIESDLDDKLIRRNTGMPPCPLLLQMIQVN
jgi:hypothetical protein